MSQVLLLWDRIIGFNTLELLPILAASIFVFRAHNLLEVRRHHLPGSSLQFQ